MFFFFCSSEYLRVKAKGLFIQNATAAWRRSRINGLNKTS